MECHHAAARSGAHGEMTGLLLIRAYLEKQGNPRKSFDSGLAHRNESATAVIAGYEVENIKSESQDKLMLTSCATW